MIKLEPSERAGKAPGWGTVPSRPGPLGGGQYGLVLGPWVGDSTASS